jgi:hypothetical protein
MLPRYRSEGTRREISVSIYYNFINIFYVYGCLARLFFETKSIANSLYYSVLLVGVLVTLTTAICGPSHPARSVGFYDLRSFQSDSLAEDSHGTFSNLDARKKRRIAVAFWSARNVKFRKILRAHPQGTPYSWGHRFGSGGHGERRTANGDAN